MTRRISSREARANFSYILGQVHHTKEPIIIERNGRPMAALVDPERLAQLELIREPAFAAVDRIALRNALTDAETLRLVTEEVDAVRRDRGRPTVATRRH